MPPAVGARRSSGVWRRLSDNAERAPAPRAPEASAAVTALCYLLVAIALGAIVLLIRADLEVADLRRELEAARSQVIDTEAAYIRGQLAAHNEWIAWGQAELKRQQQ